MILEVIKKRRSIRKFQDKEIPPSLVEEMIEALRWAPSAGNLQARKFYFVFNKEIRDKIARACYQQEFISQAPLVIVGCLDRKIKNRYGERGVNLYGICDVSASIQNLMIFCESKGVGSCWVGAFQEDKISEILKLPSDLRPVVVVPVGYTAQVPSPPSRYPKEKIIEVIK